MAERLVTSLAILKVNWDKGRDYIANYVPFVAECLRKAPQPEVSLADLQAAVNAEFGLKIPLGALKTVLRRAAKIGFVTPTEGIYRRNDAALARLDLAPVRDDMLRRYEALMAKLIDFCANRYDVRWSPEDAEAAILAYLQEHSAAILASAVAGEPVPVATESLKHADFLVNAFIAHLHESDPDGFDFLETIVKGSMLANVMFFPDLGSIPRRFEQVEVFFDTAFLLRALGLEGESRQAPCRELISLVYEQNGAPRCFDHTFNEIRRVLGAAARGLLKRGNLRLMYGDTLEYLIHSGYKASDVELAIARLEKSLHALRVQVRPRPAHTVPLGVDEVKLRALLQQEVHYRREETLDHDLDAITAIHRLRRGQFPPHIEACSAIFVTTNRSLARAGLRFLTEEYGEEFADIAHAVPACILDEHFTALVWLKQPSRAPDLPRKRIIANCYAALNPSNDLWKLYLHEIDRLQKAGELSEDDFTLLRFSTVVRSAVMDATFGDPEAFTEGTVQEILEKAQASARAQTEAALAAERERREDAERRATLAEAQLEAKRRRQLQRCQGIGAGVGRWVARALLYGGTGLLAVGVYLTLPEPLPRMPGEWTRLAAPAVLVVLCALGVMTIAHLSFGTTLLSLVRRLEVSVARFVEQTLIRIAQP